jgi:hypothetical protein
MSAINRVTIKGHIWNPNTLNVYVEYFVSSAWVRRPTQDHNIRPEEIDRLVDATTRIVIERGV